MSRSSNPHWGAGGLCLVLAPHITPQAPFYFISCLFAGEADFHFLEIADTFFHRKLAGFIFMTYFRM